MFRKAQVWQQGLNRQENTGHIGGKCVGPHLSGITAVQFLTLVHVNTGIADQEINRLIRQHFGKGVVILGARDIKMGKAVFVTGGARHLVPARDISLHQSLANPAIGTGNHHMHTRIPLVD